MKYEEVIRKIAEQEGVSEEFICSQMQEAINAGYYNTDAAVQGHWKKIAPDGTVPTPERLIEVLVQYIKK